MLEIRGTKTILFAMLLLVIGIFGVVWQGLFFVFFLVALFGLWWLSDHLEIGWYILVFLSPMIHWMLRGVDYWYLFRDYPFFLNIQAPLVEFWALYLLIAFVLFHIRQWGRGEKQTILLPGVFWFGLFMVSAFVSLVNVHPTELSARAWYAIRFMLFCYVAYIIPAANIVRSKKIFRYSLYALAAGGLFAAGVGLASFFVGAWRDVYGVPRATPFVLFRGWAPFGYQHIFLGETLSTTFPVFLYFWYTEKDAAKKWWGSAAAVVLLIGLSTLSRAAWVTYLVDTIIALFLLRHVDRFQKIYRAVMTFILVSSPLIAYFLYFVFTNAIVTGSNAARFALTDIALFFWKAHPLIGNGVGSFIPMLSEVLYFEIEFGEAIDAHGIIQKILAEQGLLGVIAFGMFLYWLFRRLHARYRDTSFSQEARWVGFFSLFLVLSPFIFQLFNTQYYSSKMWIPFAIAIAGSLVYKHEKTVRSVMQINFKEDQHPTVYDI